MPVAVGAAFAAHVNALTSDAPCPSGFETITEPTPALCAGVVPVIVVAFTTVALDSAEPPTVTLAPATKFVPVIATEVPPAAGPEVAAIVVTVGAGSGLYVNALAMMPVCVSGFDTATATSPVDPRAGEVATMLVALDTVTLEDVVPPNVTVAPDTKLVPVTVTEVPPATVPLEGDTLVTVGAVAAVYV